MSTITPKYFTLADLLIGKLFRIPNYQRAYSWEKRQRDDLFQDIVKSCETDKHHFMATVVCLMRKVPTVKLGSQELKIYDIVDGQQRLTTLIALIKAISIELALGNSSDISEGLELEKILVKGNEKDLILLQTNHNEAEIFREYLVSGKIPMRNELKTKSEGNFYDLFRSCERFINDRKKESKNNDKWLINLLLVVKNRLGFIFYELEDEAVVYTVFEVLNSRGLAVNWLDKTKSALMGIVYEKMISNLNLQETISSLQNYWGDIYKVIGLDDIDGDEILTYSSTLIVKDESIQVKLVSLQGSVDLFKKLSFEDVGNALKIAKVILNVANNYKKLSLIPKYQFFYSRSQCRFLYISLLLNEYLQEDEKSEILIHWEKVSFRIFGLMLNDSKQKVTDYIKLGREIYHNNIKNPFIRKVKPVEFTQFDALNFKDKIIYKIREIGRDTPIELAIGRLNEKDCYKNWEMELKYFFYKYEQYISDKKNATYNDNIWTSIFNFPIVKSIEHIVPQKDQRNLWPDIVDRTQENFEVQINRLGNLLILPPLLNSRCSNKDFNGKKVIYKEALSHIVNDAIYDSYIPNGDAVEKVYWSMIQIEHREKNLVIAAMEIWA